MFRRLILAALMLAAGLPASAQMSGGGGAGGVVTLTQITAALGGTAATTGTLTSGNFPIANGASSLVDSGYAPAPTSQPLDFSYANTASTPAVSITGALFTGGSGTTTMPALKIGNQAATTWATAGTAIGVSLPTGFAGNFEDHKLNDVSIHTLSTTAAAFTFSASGFSAQVNALNLTLKNTNLYCWSSTASASGSCDTALSRRAAANIVLGSAPAASPVANILSGQSSRSGTDTNVGGANVTIEAGTGTGTGTAAQLLLRTPTTVASGTGAQTMTTRLAMSAGGITANGPINYAADAGSNDTYVITLSPAPSAYFTGMMVVFKANTVNTGAASLNVNGLGAVTIVKAQNTTLANSDILANMICVVVHDGTNFVLMNPRAL